MLGREAKKGEAKRAISQPRLKKTKTVDGRNRQIHETGETARIAAQDYADTTKLDLANGGTVAGSVALSGGSTLGGTTDLTGAMSAPGTSGPVTVNSGASANIPHGLGHVPFMYFAQASYDGGSTWYNLHDGLFGFTKWATSTNVVVTNGGGSNAIVRLRVLG